MNLPLHPLIVHIPMALGVLMPLLGLAVLVGWKLGHFPRSTWILVVGVQALLLVGAVVARETGEEGEERVEKVVPEEALHEHEEASEIFTVAAGLALALSVAVLFVGDGLALPLAGGAVLLFGIVLGLGLRLGHLGGELVYQHGAASAYVSESPARGLPAVQDKDDD